jgi:hypothetical protein
MCSFGGPHYVRIVHIEGAGKTCHYFFVPNDYMRDA